MHIYLIRHGQSTNNAGMTRLSDPPLTALGQQQADCAAAALRQARLTHLYASPMLRALQTAAAIAGATGVPLHITPDYCETCGLREATGMTRAQMQALHPTARIAEAITEAGWWHGAEESMEAAAERAACTARNLREQHPEEARIAVVTHGEFGSFLLCAFLGLDTAAMVKGSVTFETCNAGITLLNCSPEAVFVCYQNRAQHLPEELVTGCSDP